MSSGLSSEADKPFVCHQSPKLLRVQMDFLAASQNVDNNNTNKVSRYMSMRLSNLTQTQTHEIQNQEVFSIKALE